MSPEIKKVVDLPAFLRAQRQERYPSVVVHGPPLCGKTTFARALGKKYGCSYLDVLDYIGQRPEIATQIESFDSASFKVLLLDYASETAADIVLIDEMDFLLSMWVGEIDALREMVRQLQHHNRTTVFAFFLQTQSNIEAWDLLTASRTKRVLAFDEIQPL